MHWAFIVLIVVLGLVFLFLIGCLLIGFFLTKGMAWPVRHTRKECYDVDAVQGLFAGLEDLKFEPIVMTMSDGYEIHGDVVLNGNNDKWVICTHGYTCTREGTWKYLLPFYQRGYSLLAYDVRSHGENLIKDVTMGFKEHKDLHEIIGYVRKTYGEEVHVGLLGESMGAATSCLCASFRDPLDFIVSDCGYASLPLLIKHLLKQRHLPTFLLPFANVSNRLLEHYSVYKLLPYKALEENEVPILFMHGDIDTFVPPEHARIFYDANKGYKELHYFKGCEHALSIVNCHEEYIAILNAFLDKVEKGIA